MKKLFETLAIATCLVFGPVTLCQAVNFQSSQALGVELGIRDKNGELGKYDVTFVVTAPDKKQYKKTISVEGDAFGTVRFPNDFDAYTIPGKYSWQAVVKNKVAVRGEFEQVGTFSLRVIP